MTIERENLRQLFLDFIDLGEDEEVWQRHLKTYDDLLAENARREEDFKLFRDSVVKPVLKHVYSAPQTGDEERNRLLEIEQEWLTMWATLEELNLVASVRQNMEEHGFDFD